METSRRTQLSDLFYEEAAATRRLVVALDQVDELPERDLAELDRQLNRWLDDPHAPRLVICCRSSTLDRLPALAGMSGEAHRPGVRVHLNALTRDDIADYLDAAGVLHLGRTATESQWTDLQRELDRPVRLVAAALAFEGRSLDVLLDELRSGSFWDVYFERRLAEDLPRGYDAVTVMGWLTWLSGHSKRGGPFWPSDGRLHRSIRGALKVGPGLIAVAIAVLLLVRSDRLPAASTALAYVVAATCPLLALYSVGDGRMRYLRASRHRVAQGVVWGTLAGAALSVPFLIVVPPMIALAVGLALGTVVGVRWVTAVEFDSEGDVYEAHGPDDLVRRALTSGFVFGPLYGIAFTCPLGLLIGWVPAITWAMPWLCLGGQGGFLHYALWQVQERLVHGGPTVGTLLSFLSWADARSLLRRHGPGYEFLHVETWEYFRQRADDRPEPRAPGGRWTIRRPVLRTPIQVERRAAAPAS